MQTFSHGMTRLKSGLLGALLLAVLPGVADAATMTEFDVPSANASPQSMALGSDGAVWFTETGVNKIGKITTNGQITEYNAPSGANNITLGPDGALWFTGNNQSLGRITVSGVFSEIPVPGSFPQFVSAGPDGALWFTDIASNSIGRYALDGSLTTYPLPTSNAAPTGITTGPDGALWFCETTNQAVGSGVGRISVDGVISEYHTGQNNACLDIRTGSDGALWFTERNAPSIGRITTTGTISHFGSGAGAPAYLTLRSNGNIWFTKGFGDNNIAEISPSGVVTEYPIPASNAFGYGIVTGSDGNIWFTEVATNKIGRLSFGSPAPQTLSLPASADTFIRSGQSNSNQGAGVYMRLQSSGSNRALLKFDQSSLASQIGSGTLISAKLRLTIADNGNNWGASGRTVNLQRLLAAWAEGNGTQNSAGTGTGATWNCAVDAIIGNAAKNCSGTTEWEMGQPSNPSVHPWAESASATTTITNGRSGVVELDVTGDVAAFLAGTPNNGWLLKKSAEGQSGQVDFGTKESSNGPALVVTYQP